MKKFFTSLLLATTIATSSINVFASESITVYVDGTKVTYSSAPIVQNGSTLVPLRQTFQALGSTVVWDNATQTITATKDDTIIDLTIGDKTAHKNNDSFTISVPPQIINGSTYVPLRFVAESFGSDVKFDSATQIITINSNNSAATTTTDKVTTPTNNTQTGSTGYSIADGKLTYKNKQYTIIDVAGGDLSGDRQPSVAVDVGYGDRQYWGLTNENSQLVYVLADTVKLQDANTETLINGRYYSDEAKVPGTESATLDEGHVIADSLGGVSNAYNITPQDSTLNRNGDQAYMEKVIRDANGCTNFVATITYPNTSTQTPSKYKYEYILMGSKVVDEFENKSPETTTTTNNNNTSTTTNNNNNTTTSEDISKIDTNGNGIVTVAEAKAAGFKMPITSDHWLYKYMKDADGDGKVGE